MKEEHYLSCEHCGISFNIHKHTRKVLKEAAIQEAFEHEAKCLSLAVGQRVMFIKESSRCGASVFTGEILWLHRASTEYHKALAFIQSDQRMYEPSNPDPESLNEQGRGVLVEWDEVLCILS